MLTGAFEESALLPLVEQLLASIPPSAAPAPRTPQDATPLPFAFPEHPVREDVRSVPARGPARSFLRSLGRHTYATAAPLAG